ncbi:MAG: AbrB/MazE/SpoVT family DNA-binding domain-containing protein [Candidatus Bathyarchaeia archaeon]
MSNLIKILETFFKTNVDYKGRIYIPKKVRSILEINEGETVYIKIDKERGYFKVYTTKALRLQINEKELNCL